MVADRAPGPAHARAQSITGELFASWFGGEAFAAYEAAGCALIIVGLVVVTRYRIKVPQDAVMRLDGEEYGIVAGGEGAGDGGRAAWSSRLAFALDDDDDGGGAG